MKSPYLLENLYVRLGRPSWFWPAVMVMILVIWIGASSILSEDFQQ